MSFVKSTSPLRYPGSKREIAPLVAAAIQNSGNLGAHFAEPFAGGASVSLFLLANGFINSVTLCEADPLLFSFWEIVRTNPGKLIDRIMTTPINVESWEGARKFLQYERISRESMADAAFAALFLNRTNYSGVLKAGPIGGRSQTSEYPIDCRFNKEEVAKSISDISRLSEFIEVVYGDGTQYIREARDVFLFVDPPYVDFGKKYYRYNFGMIQHLALCEALTDTQENWILTYDDNDVVWSMYERFSLYRYAKINTARVYNARHDLVITNLDVSLEDIQKTEITDGDNYLERDSGAA